MQNKQLAQRQENQTKLQSIEYLQPVSTTTSRKKTTSSSRRKITSRDIALLWMRMTNLFGNKFVANYGVKDNGAWLMALEDLTPNDLRYGFERMIRQLSAEERKIFEVWPPNGKVFRLLCEKRFEDFGLPHVNKAVNEIRLQWRDGKNFSHPLIGIALDMTGENEQVESYEFFVRFRTVYNELCESYMNGELAGLLQYERGK